jgi:toxin-antitoxin system PIN domain toxin
LILCDASVLIHAFRADAEYHDYHKTWLESVINSPAAYGVSTQVLAHVIRVCTHPRIFARPSSLEDVLEFCRMLLEQPNATVIAPGQRHWSMFESICHEFNATGNIVQNAWFTALAIESSCEWVTADRDYARFKAVS